MPSLFLRPFMQLSIVTKQPVELLRRLSAARQLLPESADASGSSLKSFCAGEHVTVMWLCSISDSQNTSLCSIVLPCPSTNLELSCCQALCLSEKHVGSAEPAASAAVPQQQPASSAQPHPPLQPECGLGADTASPHVQTHEHQHGQDAAQLHVAKDEHVEGIQDAATASPTVGLLPDRVPAHLSILCTYAIVVQVKSDQCTCVWSFFATLVRLDMQGTTILSAGFTAHVAYLLGYLFGPLQLLM